MSRFIAIYKRDGNLVDELEIAQRVSPYVEIWAPDAIIVQISARHEQETLDQLKSAHLNLGVASTRTAAYFMARVRSGTVIPTGQEPDFLAALPVQLLLGPLTERPLHSSSSGRCSGRSMTGPELTATFRRWGIRIFGELAALPQSELVARLGEEAVHLQKIARGEDVHPAQLYAPPLQFEQSQDLEWMLDSLESLAFILGSLLDRLCSDLRNYGLAAASLRVVLKLSNRTSHERTLQPAFPTYNPKLLLSLARLDLQSHPPNAGIVGVTLEAKPERPRVFQYSLFQPPAPNPEKLSRVLGRLKVLVGEENVGSPRLLNTHRPDAFQMDSFRANAKASADKAPKAGPAGQLSLRRFRPPLPIRLPASHIAASAGPWRASGDWWSGLESWSRDEWDVELTNGILYRVFWDRLKKDWFLDGVYD